MLKKGKGLNLYVSGTPRCRRQNFLHQLTVLIGLITERIQSALILVNCAASSDGSRKWLTRKWNEQVATDFVQLH
jgi:hypothetical protein